MKIKKIKKGFKWIVEKIKDLKVKIIGLMVVIGAAFGIGRLIRRYKTNKIT